jgi:hypothetical protein
LTTLELTHNDFASITTHYLADTPANTPGKAAIHISAITCA